MGDLGGADAERQRTERTVGGGVTVAADDDHAGLAQPLLGTDHVHDPLPAIAQAEQRHPGGLRIAVKVLDHGAAVRLVD
jgi:hypothetical protein